MLALMQKRKKETHKVNVLMKIVFRSQNMLKTMHQIKQQDVSKVNIKPSGSRQWEILWKNTINKFLMALFKIGGHISYGITSTMANVLLSRSEDLVLKIVKATPIWGPSILQRFRRRVAITGNMDVLEGARKKAGLQHHFWIFNIIQKHNIPKSLVLNSDQTPSKYVTNGCATMVQKIQFVLVWLEVPTSAALHYHSR